MKILIVSDTHGRLNNYEKVIKAVAPVDYMIHCGDVGYDPDDLSRVRELAGCPCSIVQGNNDMMMKYNSGGAPQYNMYLSCQETAWEQGVSWTYIVDDKYQAMFDDLENPLNSFERQVEIEQEMQKYVFEEVLMVPICEYTMAFGYNSELLTPEIVDPITMGVSYQLQILGLKSTWGK